MDEHDIKQVRKLAERNLQLEKENTLLRFELDDLKERYNDLCKSSMVVLNDLAQYTSGSNFHQPLSDEDEGPYLTGK